METTQIDYASDAVKAIAQAFIQNAGISDTGGSNLRSYQTTVWDWVKQLREGKTLDQLANERNQQILAGNPGMTIDQINKVGDQLKQAFQQYTQSGGKIPGIDGVALLGESVLPQSATSHAAPQFTQIVKTPNSPQVWGQLADGQWIAFNSMDQLPEGAQIQTVDQAPTRVYSYNDYFGSQQSSGSSTGSGSSDGSGGTGGSSTGGTGTDGGGGSSGGTTGSGDLGPYADLYNEMKTYLEKLQKNGQIINPNVAITPDQLAAFTTQAATQIHPYYATQLAAATDSFLSNLGYNTEQFKNSVQQAQTQYGRNLDALGSNSADMGFAQSGIRQKKEGELAMDVQNNLDQMRSSLFNTSQNAARSFAQQYGGANVPGAPTIGSARVLPGVSGFDANTQQGLYSLSPDIYQKLIGSEQNAEKQATDTLSSQLATNSNTLTANQQTRSLL